MTDDPAERGVRTVTWIGSVLSLLGIGWLWLNLDMGDMLIAKLIFVVILGSVWVGIVFAGLGFLALVLGMAGIVTRRK